MRVLAVDPGYDRLGVAVLEYRDGKEALLFSTCLETDRALKLPDRLLSLGETLKPIFETYTPDSLAIESLFFNTNQKTAIAVAGVRGMIMYIAGTHDCTIFEYTPQEIKVAVTGYGKSDKHAVFDMAKRLIPGVPEGKLDDEYDAIAVGITCLAHNRH